MDLLYNADAIYTDMTHSQFIESTKPREFKILNWWMPSAHTHTPTMLCQRHRAIHDLNFKFCSSLFRLCLPPPPMPSLLLPLGQISLLHTATILAYIYGFSRISHGLFIAFVVISGHYTDGTAANIQQRQFNKCKRRSGNSLPIQRFQLHTRTLRLCGHLWFTLLGNEFPWIWLLLLLVNAPSASEYLKCYGNELHHDSTRKINRFSAHNVCKKCVNNLVSNI